SMEQSLELADDATTIAFYQKSYVPDMRKIMAAVSTGIPNNTTTLDPKYNTRDARNGTASTTLPANEKMTRDQNNGLWSVPISTGGLQIGSPQPNSRGGRGPVNQ
ncbi:MAG: hypothetical protein H7235_05965, partial [Bdellovibrionaceae bacterium]|nr:hypothetical protein [Pseudobdellovibrionaceae bacterium]